MFLLRRLYSKQHNPKKFIKKHHPTNPGIERQAKLLNLTSSELEDFNEFDEFESDLMNSHRAHREMEMEMQLRKEKEQYLLVKQKYFKQKLPNFLTWHDKEQIRYLHNKDPDEWTPETLSEGFPASPEIIEKIIKSTWSKNKNKIEQHDKVVIQNWQDFKQGKLDNLPDYLKEHLQKFSERSLNLSAEFQGSSTDKKQIINTPKKLGEFGQIIASYEEIKNKSKEPIVDDTQQIALSIPPSRNETSFKKYEKPVTFKELQRKLQKKVDKDKYLTEDEKAIVIETTLKLEQNNDQIVEFNDVDISNIVQQQLKINSDKVGFVKKDGKDVVHLIYPEKITIPQKYMKEGCTYKLNDCYYDSDGEFLYRVPGMV